MGKQDPTSQQNGEYPHLEQNERPKSKRTPLPKLQLFILLLIQMSEPVTATVIYPFVNQFVRETGVTRGDERKTGYFAGIIESVFFVAEALTVFHWGWASDYFGRRPILLLGPLGLSLAMLVFGLSNSFWVLVVARCLQGVFNGNIGVSKSVMMEITDSSNIGDAYALIPMMWSCGTIIGPTLGGVFSRPEHNWPDTIGRLPFLRQHPYFLPCAAAAFIALISYLIALVGLKETLPSAIARRRQRNHRKSASAECTTGLLPPEGVNYGSTTITSHSSCDRASLVSTNNQSKGSSAPSPFRALFVRRVMIPMTSFAFIAFVDMCYQVLQPLVFSTSLELGGLGFNPYRIGTIMGTWGFVNAPLQVFIIGPVIRRLGARKAHIVSHIIFVVMMALYPLLIFCTRRAGRVNANVWAVLIVQLIFQMWSGIAYCSSQFLIVESAGGTSMGATNGLTQAVSSSMRSIAPSVASSLFSISLQNKLAGGNMVFYILMGVALIGVRASLFIPRDLGLPSR